MNISPCLRVFSLFAAVACCDARAIQILSQENSIWGFWREEVRTWGWDDATQSNIITPIKTYGEFDVSATNTPLQHSVQSQPYLFSAGSAVISSFDLSMTGKSAALRSVVSSDPYSILEILRTKLVMTAQSVTTFVPSAAESSIVLAGLASYNYWTSEQNLRLQLTDLTTSEILIDFFLEPSRFTPFSHHFAPQLNPSHQYQLMFQGWYDSFDAKTVSMTANVSFRGVPDNGSSIALLSAGLFGVALFARRRART